MATRQPKKKAAPSRSAKKAAPVKAARKAAPARPKPKKKYELKTKKTGVSVDDFLGALDPGRLADCRTLVKMMKEASGKPAKMWGPSIVGFGDYHYVYESGHEGDMCE